MADETTRDILRSAEQLDVLELQALLEELQSLYRRKRATEAEHLLSRLKALGLEPNTSQKGTAKNQRRPGEPKYRSRKDPTLTWAGRGHVARWLEEEMAETGLPIEAFKIGRS